MAASTIEVWAPLAGRWKFDGPTATYLGPEDPNSRIPHGLALSPVRLRSGSVWAKVLFDETVSVGRIVFGYNAVTGAYFSVGLGGYRFAYIVDEYLPGRGWKAVRGQGSEMNLNVRAPYELELQVRGQNIRLTLDGIKVLEQNLPYPPAGDQVGLFAWGSARVIFENTAARPDRPRVFVVMQFGDPYDGLYSEVIKPVAEAMGLEVYRATEVYRPGIILRDIIRGIVEAEVVIAEITPVNANVFYELGYAHALDKPTILLAERARELPFDIRSYRCIFYDNTIRGKIDVETILKEHLRNILEGV